MSWAKYAIKALAEGKTHQIRPHGNSMKGKVNDGNLVTLEPLRDTILKPDDVVLVHVGGKDYLHLIKAVDGERYQIGNNKGGVNGWVSKNSIYGIAVKIEP